VQSCSIRKCPSQFPFVLRCFLYAPPCRECQQGIFTLKPDCKTPLISLHTDLANPFYIFSLLITLFIFPPKEDKESEDSDDSIDLKTENIR
jgi:hypothetical protein